ncbi:ORF6N domain-containing protein [Fusobacterium massiliense]|uniref:ORF6N domain-containing protein n=1 Tax=Fusobacterium massiliense TaxID=1852365 RepID=UPI0028D653A0|nr:ORF6N domain-containing protein [Fusobacterium massiliense]
MENKLVKINNVELGIKEYKKERVITAWDIGKVHNRDVGEINKIFNRNKDKFILNEDYFILKIKDFSERFKTIQDFIPNNVKEIVLFTESGYLMLVKTFTDDLSWQIQRQLVKGYFKLKEIKSSIDKDKRLEIMEKNANVRMAKMLKSLIPFSKSERYKEILVSEATKVLTGRELIPPPEVEAKTITATQIAEILGVSVQKIGIISNKYNLKTEQNGYWVHEKAKYCNKEIPNFRYFESAIEEFRKYI